MIKSGALETMVHTGKYISEPKPVEQAVARLYTEYGSGCIKAVYFQKDKFIGQVLKVGEGRYFEDYLKQINQVSDFIFVFEESGDDDALPSPRSLSDNAHNLQNSSADYVRLSDDYYRGIVFKSVIAAQSFLSNPKSVSILSSYGILIPASDLLKIVDQFG